MLVSKEAHTLMSIKTKLRATSFALIMNLIRLILRYLAGGIVGIVFSVTASKFLLKLLEGGTFSGKLIPESMLLIAIPSILIWHVVNEVARLCLLRFNHIEHITAVAVGAVAVIWFASMRGMNNALAYVEQPILVGVFVTSALLNSVVYYQLLKMTDTHVPNLR